jgi:hypothetical protein
VIGEVVEERVDLGVPLGESIYVSVEGADFVDVTLGAVAGFAIVEFLGVVDFAEVNVVNARDIQIGDSFG